MPDPSCSDATNGQWPCRCGPSRQRTGCRCTSAVPPARSAWMARRPAAPSVAALCATSRCVAVSPDTARPVLEAPSIDCTFHSSSSSSSSISSSSIGSNSILWHVPLRVCMLVHEKAGRSRTQVVLWHQYHNHAARTGPARHKTYPAGLPQRPGPSVRRRMRRGWGRR